MRLYMLDTNVVSHALRGNPRSVDVRLNSIPVAQVVISVITEAELLYGLAKRPEAHQLKRTLEIFLKQVRSLPWTSAVARIFADLNADLERQGTPMGLADVMIAAHALAEDTVLVTNDAAFGRVRGLRIEDWTR